MGSMTVYCTTHLALNENTGPKRNTGLSRTSIPLIHQQVMPRLLREECVRSANSCARYLRRVLQPNALVAAAVAIIRATVVVRTPYVRKNRIKQPAPVLDVKLGWRVKSL